MMSIYIQAASSISPQRTFGDIPFLAERVEHAGNRLKSLEPDYTTFIDPKSIRRMSRIIRMGVTAALDCLREAGMKSPDAIVTGTAFGCLADTDVFLSRVIEQQEEMLPPTAFIQSTHNTVGGQIALMLQCHGYNNTFVHRGSSFESALLDAMLLLEEKEADHVLAGGLDEITDNSHAILTRLGFYKGGAIAGEGATFFLLAARHSPGALAKLDALDTFYKPKDAVEVERNILSFLKQHSIGRNEIDLVITGNNGDHSGDQVYEKLQESVFKDVAVVPYKDLCGEYPTSTSFALWLAARIIRAGSLPAALSLAERGGAPQKAQRGKIKKVLIYNHYQFMYHSLLLVSDC